MDSNGADRSRSDRLAKGEPGVLASLPSTRPQRPSTRRAEARRAARARAEQPASNGSEPIAGRAHTARAAKAGAGQSTKSSAKRAAKARRGPAIRHLGPDEQLPAPPQGFDTEGGIEPGVPVQPPSGVELVASVVELAGELAQSTVSTGGRLIKNALGLLPGL
jgi:hypothetical protein